MAAEMLLLLACPVAGGAVLALAGHRRYAAELNAIFAIVTFGAAARRGARGISGGPVRARGEDGCAGEVGVGVAEPDGLRAAEAPLSRQERFS